MQENTLCLLLERKHLEILPFCQFVCNISLFVKCMFSAQDMLIRFISSSFCTNSVSGFVSSSPPSRCTVPRLSFGLWRTAHSNPSGRFFIVESKTDTKLLVTDSSEISRSAAFLDSPPISRVRTCLKLLGILPFNQKLTNSWPEINTIWRESTASDMYKFHKHGVEIEAEKKSQIGAGGGL